MATITYLPSDVITIILCDENICFKDIMSLALTCKEFYSLINNNELWRKKFYQRWPYLREEYDKQLCKETTNFFEQVKAGIKSQKELWHYMSLMSEKFYHKNDLFDIDFKDFHSLFDPDRGAYFMNYHFFVNELIRLLAQSPADVDLTQTYYAKKLLSYLHHYRLRNMWYKFINCPEEQQILEQAAIILAQWYQPQKYVSLEYVRTSLDNIAQQVLEYLKDEYPAHPIFSVSAEQLSFWKYNNIDDNHWDSAEGRQIIESLCKILYDRLGFHGNFEESWECETKSTLEYAFIDCVLKDKLGIAVTLGIIYHSVARRLGIRCDLISFPTHFFLCWRAKYHTTNVKDKECFYIDVLRDGSMLSKNDCPIINSAGKCPISWLDKYMKISPVEIMLRMSNYLYAESKSKNIEDKTMQRLFLELTCLIDPNTSAINDLARIYVQYQADISDLTVMLEKIQDNCKLTKPVEARRAEQLLNKFRSYTNLTSLGNMIVKQRTENIKFSVGMIVMFYDEYLPNMSGYIGVIIGWDEKYVRRAEFDNSCKIIVDYTFNENVQDLGSSSSPDFRFLDTSKPFYIILCENGKTYYVIEGALKMCKRSVQISHKDIGRYFCKFEQTYYVPNEMLAKCYPHDNPNGYISQDNASNY